MSLAFDTLQAGQRIVLGSHTFSRTEITAFARRFDPQPFHLDEDAAKATIYGGLIAPGLLVTAVWLRFMIDYRNREAQWMRFAGEPVPQYGPSPGFSNMRWLKPVRPGDTLTYSSTVAEVRALASKPNLGLAMFDNQAVNQDGTLVFELTSKVFVERIAAV